MPDLTPTTIAIGVGGLVILAAYAVLILAPAWGSYGRWWERFAASFMTLFILATFVGLGVGIGAAIALNWDRI